MDAMVLILYIDMKGSFLSGDSQNIIFNTFCIKCILKAHNDFSKYLQIAWKKMSIISNELTGIIIVPKGKALK